jgi:hypothetical protein
MEMVSINYWNLETFSRKSPFCVSDLIWRAPFRWARMLPFTRHPTTDGRTFKYRILTKFIQPFRLQRGAHTYRSKSKSTFHIQGRWKHVNKLNSRDKFSSRLEYYLTMRMCERICISGKDCDHSLTPGSVNSNSEIPTLRFQVIFLLLRLIQNVSVLLQIFCLHNEVSIIENTFFPNRH